MNETTNTSIVANINKEINLQLTAETSNALLATAFKGLNATTMKQAIMDGMLRGFDFKSFLKKDVYALPYGTSYSLITSIDYSRKIGMRSGIVGKDSPVYEISEDGKKIIACSVTVHKRFESGYIGDFTATVYFSEYSSGKNLWVTKPRTMIAKVAEMHALRMACPEELSQQYIEEEMELKNRSKERAEEATRSSESIKMGNIIKPNEESTIKEARVVNEENQDETADAKGNKNLFGQEPGK